MKFYIVIPAHNEAHFIEQTLESLVKQTLLPKKVVVVNDNSTDETEDIVKEFTNKYEFIRLVNKQSSVKHLPGAKIIQAFYTGLETLDDDYDILCKFDADLIFPKNYLEKLSYHFKNNAKLGMAAGHCYFKKGEELVLENLTRKDHIRGALKAYRKGCFVQIEGLKKSMGWDTVDELLAKYYGWQISTDESLKVIHLKPTGANYNKASKYLQGKAMYKMRLGFTLTFITALKLGLKKKSFSFFFNYLVGYLEAFINKNDRIVTKEQGKFIRNLRWKGILHKLS